MAEPGVNGVGPIQVLHPTNLFLQQRVQSLLLQTNLIIALGKKRTGKLTMTMVPRFLVSNKTKDSRHHSCLFHEHSSVELNTTA